MLDTKQLRLLREKKRGASPGGSASILPEEIEVGAPQGTDAVLDEIDHALEATMTQQELMERATKACSCFTF